MSDQFLADDEVAYAARVRQAVGTIGGGYFLSQELKTLGQELGLAPWPGYFLGRCGVLGSANPDIVASIVGFFPLDFVEDCWVQVQQRDFPLGIRNNLLALDTWSERVFGQFADVERLAQIAEDATLAASPVGAPLFAGWRDTPGSAHVAGRMVRALLALRELRGAMHLSAVLAEGVTPREAILVGPGGVGNARFFGWNNVEVAPERLEFVSDGRKAAERRTDRMAARVWMKLDLEERFELATLLEAALVHMKVD